MLDKIDFTQLREQSKAQARKFYAACRNQAPKETLYGLAFCIDSDVRSFYCQANSEEKLENAGDRYFVNEWQFNDGQASDANEALAAVWAAFQEIASMMDEAKADKLQGQVRKACLKAIVQGLTDFRQAESLPKDFALVVYDPDPGDIEEINKMARELNSAKTYKAFIDPDNGNLYAE